MFKGYEWISIKDIQGDYKENLPISALLAPVLFNDQDEILNMVLVWWKYSLEILWMAIQ